MITNTGGVSQRQAEVMLGVAYWPILEARRHGLDNAL